MEHSIKRNRGLWTLQQLEAAMAAVKDGVMSQRAAAKHYSIPRRTLVNHLKSGKVEKQIGRRTIMTKQQENDLASRIKRLASIGFPLTPKLLRHQAFVFCESNNIPNNFNKSTKRAGKDWLKLFLKRHTEISKRKVQILNPGRAQKLNKAIVMQHFQEYKKIYEQLDIANNPQRLYNMDEKGCRLTIHNQPLVLAQKGSKRVHMVAQEHAENVTIAACVNALGNAIPPMILFKGKRMKPEYNDNLPSGSLVKMAPKGSMTTSLFVDFIHHLGKFKSDGQCLLIFDGASCHLDYSIVDAADKENIILYCLPSNTTHELQPLDKSVNKSFEHHWDEEVLTFTYQHPEKKITKARFNSIFSRVWSKCMTHDIIVNGFKSTGLYPFYPEAIPSEAYAPSVLTERHCQQENVIPRCDSPIPGPSGINKSHTKLRPQPDSSDSDATLCENQSPSSPSLLQPDLSQPHIEIIGVKKRLVSYSTTDSDSPDPGNHNTNTEIRRPVIYSSDTDSSSVELTKMLNEPGTKSFFGIYSSSTDNENENSATKQDRTPIKQITARHVKATKSLRPVTSDENSEDDVPLRKLQERKKSFQELIPTPNFAIVKQNPKRKAINYKAQIVTKNLFEERQTHKEKNKKRERNISDTDIEKQRKSNLKEGHRRKVNIKDRSRRCEKGKKVKESKKKSKLSRDEIDTNDRWYCYACNTERLEDMRQCPLCQKWFHEACVGLTKEDTDFACPMCN